MQPAQHRGDTVSGGSNGHMQQYANAVVSERIDSLVYGYLRRMGYNTAADGMDRESPFLSGSVARSRGDSRTIITINDRVHDHTLEQIIHLFCQDGRFGVNQNLLEFGEDLRRLTNRFTTITSAGAPGRSTLHEQLYGRPSYSRQTPQNYTLRMAPQARAQLELQKIAQIGEMRYREEQQKAHLEQMQTQVQAHQQAQQEQAANSSVPLLPQPSQHLPTQPYEEGEIAHSSQSAVSEGSSRRKHHQPQSFNAMIRETVIDPLVGLINERPWNEIENIQIDDNAFFQSLNVIDENFLAMYDYTQQGCNDFEEPFGDIITSPNFPNEDQPGSLHFDAEPLPIEDEVVLKTSGEAKPSYHFPNPSPLLSPLPKDMTFQKHSVESPKAQSQQHISKNVENPRSSKRPDHSRKREGSVELRDKLISEDREKKERRFESSRNGSVYRSSEEPKRKNDEKKKYKEKERDREREKSTNRDENPEEHASASERHSSKQKLQSDRESTSSSSSRPPPPVSSDTSENSLRKDLVKRRSEKEEKRNMEKEKERQKQTLPLMNLNVDSKVGGDMLNKVRKSHAAASSTDSRGDSSTRESSKRKADEVLTNRRDFKIPKKGSSTSKPELKTSYGAQVQSSSSVRESLPQTSSKREKENVAKNAELCHGEDRPDATHFLTPRGHIARLSSMFVNNDKGYEAFQQGLRKNRKDSNVVLEDALSDVSMSPPASSGHFNAHDNNMAGSSQANARPNKPLVAPQKGYLLNKSPSKTPSTEDSSAEESDKESQDDEDPFPQKKSFRRSSESPDQNKYCREIDMEKANAMLNRIHGTGK